MGGVPDSPAGPELIFGIAGPIGVDIIAICDSLQSCLRAVRYDSEIIHLTTEMMIDVTLASPPKKPAETDFYSDVNFKIEYANEFCKEFVDAAALGRVALRAISRRREKLSGDPKKPPTTSTAYIIRQLKGRVLRAHVMPVEKAISLDEFDDAVRQFLKALQLAGVALPTDAVDVIDLFKKK